MAKTALNRCIATVMYVGLSLCSQPSEAREPPSANCIDLQDLTGGWRTGERELLIRSAENTGARLELDVNCSVFAEGVDLETLAPGGWACPDHRMSVRGGGTTCPVSEMTLLSEPEFAEALHAWEVRVQPSVTLEQIEVRAHNWRDIRGTTDYCVDARFLRGWNWSSEGLVVEVSPRRHSGHRYYRVETVENCSALASASSIRLVARSGGAAVCGHPGDKVLLDDASAGLTNASWLGRSCEISQVTPQTRE